MEYNRGHEHLLSIYVVKRGFKTFLQNHHGSRTSPPEDACAHAIVEHVCVRNLAIMLKPYLILFDHTIRRYDRS